MAYVHKVLVALDDFANAMTGGKTDETISSRLARARLRGNWVGRAGCTVLGWISGTDHCSKALLGDANRAAAELDRDPTRPRS